MKIVMTSQDFVKVLESKNFQEFLDGETKKSIVGAFVRMLDSDEMKAAMLERMKKYLEDVLRSNPLSLKAVRNSKNEYNIEGWLSPVVVQAIESVVNEQLFSGITNYVVGKKIDDFIENKIEEIITRAVAEEVRRQITSGALSEEFRKEIDDVMKSTKIVARSLERLTDQIVQKSVSIVTDSLLHETALLHETNMKNN